MTPKQSIALDPARVPALQSAYSAIEPLYKHLTFVSATLGKMRTDEADLRQKIVQLEESTSYNNEEASLSLKGKIAQLELLQRQAAKLLADIPDKSAELARHLDSLNGLIPHATLPECDKLAKRIAKSLKPVFGSSSPHLEAVVKLAPEYLGFIGFFQRRWFNDGENIENRAAQALPVLAALIAGENPWTFATE
ncbi:MAG: hypothetical protein JWQ04_3184 [Pedosphaera sp.]|nr:hypothetical protein [Pedosphaera sp.]